MAGGNTLIDHDLSRSHTRIGVGAEYWRDYLKLSTNESYLGLLAGKNRQMLRIIRNARRMAGILVLRAIYPAWPQLLAQA